MDYFAQQALIKRDRRKRQNQQRQSTKAILPGIATYSGRDTVSGYREIVAPDGGLGFAEYISSAKPPEQPDLYIRGGLGKPGIISSKPA